jgi:hypothetical protein
LLEALALPAPSLAIEQADAHNLRGRLLMSRDPRSALAEYRMAFDLFGRLWRDKTTHYSAPVHQRYQDFLFNLARLARERDDPDVHVLVVRATSAYLELGQASLTPSSAVEARLVVGGVSELLPQLPERDRAEIVKSQRALEAKLAAYK